MRPLGTNVGPVGKQCMGLLGFNIVSVEITMVPLGMTIAFGGTIYRSSSIQYWVCRDHYGASRDQYGVCMVQYGAYR